MSLSREQSFSVAATGACLLALGVAWGSERLLGLVPCAFCLLERRPYYLGAVVGLIALALPRRAARMALWLLAAIVLVGAGLSFVHVGVEQHWWPDPLPECTVPNFTGMTAGQRLAAMPLRPAKPCEDPDYLVPGIPVSFTQMAFAYALAFCATLAICLSRTKGRRFR